MGKQVGKEVRRKVKYLKSNASSRTAHSHPPSLLIGNKLNCTFRIQLSFDICLPDEQTRCTPRWARDGQEISNRKLIPK